MPGACQGWLHSLWGSAPRCQIASLTRNPLFQVPGRYHFQVPSFPIHERDWNPDLRTGVARCIFPRIRLDPLHKTDDQHLPALQGVCKPEIPERYEYLTDRAIHCGPIGSSTRLPGFHETLHLQLDTAHVWPPTPSAILLRQRCNSSDHSAPLDTTTLSHH